MRRQDSSASQGSTTADGSQAAVHQLLQSVQATTHLRGRRMRRQGLESGMRGLPSSWFVSLHQHREEKKAPVAVKRRHVEPQQKTKLPSPVNPDHKKPAARRAAAPARALSARLKELSGKTTAAVPAPLPLLSAAGRAAPRTPLIRRWTAAKLRAASLGSSKASALFRFYGLTVPASGQRRMLSNRRRRVLRQEAKQARKSCGKCESPEWGTLSGMLRQSETASRRVLWGAVGALLQERRRAVEELSARASGECLRLLVARSFPLFGLEVEVGSLRVRRNGGQIVVMASETPRSGVILHETANYVGVVLWPADRKAVESLRDALLKGREPHGMTVPQVVQIQKQFRGGCGTLLDLCRLNTSDCVAKKQKSKKGRKPLTVPKQKRRSEPLLRVAVIAGEAWEHTPSNPALPPFQSPLQCLYSRCL